MTRPDRGEYFRREAGDVLRELEGLLGPGTPPVEALRRLARGLRGAAMLAGHSTFAEGATELERVIRRLAEGGASWAEVGPVVRKAVGQFQRLVEKPERWDATSDRAAAVVADHLQAAAGGRPVGRTRETDAARYLAREARRVAESLDRAARHSAAGGVGGGTPQVSDALGALRGFRGLAGLEDHPPLAELVDAAEIFLADQASDHLGPDDAELVSHAGGAIRRVAVAVEAGIPPNPDDPQITAFVDRLAGWMSDQVVPVEDLLDADAQASVVAFGGRGDAAEVPALELAGLSDAMRGAARAIESAQSVTARRLAALVQAHRLRALGRGLGRRPAGRFLAAVITRLERDPARAADVSAVLERGADILAPASGSNARPASELERALDQLIGEPAVAVPSDENDADVVPIEDLLLDDIVPIESLLLDEVVPIESLLLDDVVPIEALEPEPVPIGSLEVEPVPIDELAPSAGDRTPFERSLSTYARLIRSAAEPPPLFGAAEAGGTVTVQEVVAIERLLYRGRRALERAEEVRLKLETALPARTEDLPKLEPLFRELMDLLPLALAGND